MARSNTTVATTCPYCGVGCGVLATPQTDGTITIEGNPEHPANFGRLCSKGTALSDTIGLEGRLLHPQIKGEKVSWNKALDHVADSFSAIIKKHGPDAVAFYVSGQILTEDYYVANKLMKGFIGSGNIDTNSRLCMSSAVAGYKRAFGSDSVPCSYEDLVNANLIVIEGSNTAWCHPVVFQRITQAKEDNPDLIVIVIDPRKTATCEIADLHLPIKPGSDATLFNGLLCYLEQQGRIDTDYVKQYTEGFDDALKAAQLSSKTITQVAKHCELNEADIEKLYALFSETEKVVTLYSQGITQNSSGTDKANAVINCHLATGRLGKPAMGPFSITGQPNAMGGREVGGLANQLAAHMEIDNPKHHDIVSRFWNTGNLTQQAGAKAVDLFNDVGSGKIKAVWIMATNPAVSMPDTNKVREALAKCELVVVSDCDSHTDTIQYADVLLPALGWGEKDGSVTNSERRISRQRGLLPHPGEARADWQIITQVAQRMGFTKDFPYTNAASIFREHAELSAFENNTQGNNIKRDFDISGLANLSDAEYDQLIPIQWPVNDAFPQGCQRLFEDKKFFTPSQKARFLAITPRAPKNPTCDLYPLVFNTGRLRDQWHTMTRTARCAKLNGHISEPMVEIHPDDASKYGLEDNALAKIESRWGDMLARVNITETQRQGSVFTPMHWNQQYASHSNMGALVAPVVDPVSGQPESKHTPVKIGAYQAKWYGFILSRKALDPVKSQYWVRIKGERFWRYELAGGEVIENPEAWAKSLLLNDKTSKDSEEEWLAFSDKNQQRYRAAVIKNDQLESLLFKAPHHELPARSWLSQLFAEEALSDENRMNLLAGKPGADMPDIGAIVCACFGVGENTIKEAISCGKAKTFENIGEQLQAGTNCGSCIPELKKLCAANYK